MIKYIRKNIWNFVLLYNLILKIGLFEYEREHYTSIHILRHKNVFKDY